jgi:O-antigen/teichoic acid export membrane protein
LLIFGREFGQARSSLIILSIGWILYSASSSASQMLVMSGRQKLRLMNMVGLLGLTFLLNLFLIPKYNLNGAAISIALALALFGLTELGQVYFFLKAHPYRLDFLKPVAAGAVTSVLFLSGLKKMGGGAPRPPATLLLEALVFLAVYGGLLRIAGWQTEDKVVLKRITEIFRGRR